MSDIRVRFAPSPTGKVHIGNIRAAIYNWLYARHTGGKFLLRVEDTDLERSTPEAIQVLFDCMQWLGLDYDEEVFYQTKNVKRHLEVVEELKAKGFAYECEKTSRDGKTGKVVMFKMPTEGVIEFDDIVKGHMAKKAEDLQDFAIVRSDGSPIFCANSPAFFQSGGLYFSRISPAFFSSNHACAPAPADSSSAS